MSLNNRSTQRPASSSTAASVSAPASSSPKLSPFQTHLSFFAPAQTPTLITLPSALKSSLRLGLNFPISLFLAVALRILYAEFPYYWRPVDIERIPRDKWRTQLEGSTVEPDSRQGNGDTHQTGFTCAELLRMADHRQNSGAKGLVKRLIDKGHVLGFWSMAADVETNRVSADCLSQFQVGTWGPAVAARRRFKHASDGDVLPFARGGPLSVTAHSWAVGKVLGVGVYEEGKGR